MEEQYQGQLSSVQSGIQVKIATFIVLFFPIVGGVLFIAGSIVYWPSLTNVNPYFGGTFFAIGSVTLAFSDLASSYIQPQFNLLKPWTNVGAFRAFGMCVGNIAFIIGSIYFLPNTNVLVGEDLFVISSLWQFVPEIMSIWGVCSLNAFTAPFYVKMVKFKSTIIYMNISLFGGCFCFVIGTVLFQNQNTQSLSLFQEGVMLFAVGSFLYVLSSLLALKMKKERLADPLVNYHQDLYQNYLSADIPIIQNFKLRFGRNKREQNILISLSPSIKNGQKVQEITKF